MPDAPPPFFVTVNSGRCSMLADRGGSRVKNEEDRRPESPRRRRHLRCHARLQSAGGRLCWLTEISIHRIDHTDNEAYYLEGMKAFAETDSLTRRQPARVRNGRCRMHGGASPGAPRGNTNARKHGLYSAESRCAAGVGCALARDARPGQERMRLASPATCSAGSAPTGISSPSRPRPGARSGTASTAPAAGSSTRCCRRRCGRAPAARRC